MIEEGHLLAILDLPHHVIDLVLAVAAIILPLLNGGNIQGMWPVINHIFLLHVVLLKTTWVLELVPLSCLTHCLFYIDLCHLRVEGTVEKDHIHSIVERGHTRGLHRITGAQGAAVRVQQRAQAGAEVRVQTVMLGNQHVGGPPVSENGKRLMLEYVRCWILFEYVVNYLCCWFLPQL